MTTKSIARWVTLGALFLIPFLALYVSQGMYFPFITGKNFGFRILVEVAFAGWLVLAACDKRYRPRFSWTLVSYKTFVVWMLIAALFAVNTHKALWSNYERMDGWVTLIHLYLLLVVASSVLTAENLWKKWWLTFIGVSAWLTAHGLFQILGWAQIHQGSTRVDASLGNAEYFAGYLLFTIAIAIWQALEMRDPKQAWLRYGLLALAALQFVVLFATGTRGTLIALVAAAGFGSLLWMKEAGKQGRKIGVAIFAALVLVVGGLFVLRETSFVKASPNLERLASVFQLKEALGPRLTIWEMALQGAQERPLVGWGQEGFNYVFNMYYDPGMYAQEPWFDRAHDLYLDWLIAGGIPALLLFLAVLICAFVALYRAPVSRVERTLLLSALVGYSVQGLVVFDNLFTYLPFVMVLGMAHAVSSRPIRAVEQAPEINDTRLDTLVAPAALVVGLLLIWFVNVPGMRASAHLIEGLTPGNAPASRLASFKQSVADDGFAHQEITEQLISFASTIASDASVPQDVRQEATTFADSEMRAELERAPQDARLHFQYALYLRSIGAVEEAAKQIAVAQELSPKKQSILLEQGLDQLQLGNYAQAESHFRTAYELEPRYQDPAAYLASARIIQNDLPGAQDILLQAYGTTTVDHPALFYAYVHTKNWSAIIAELKLRLLTSDDVTTRFQIAAAYSESGDRLGAINAVREAIAAHPEATEQGMALLAQLGASR